MIWPACPTSVGSRLCLANECPTPTPRAAPLGYWLLALYQLGFSPDSLPLCLLLFSSLFLLLSLPFSCPRIDTDCHVISSRQCPSVRMCMRARTGHSAAPVVRCRSLSRVSCLECRCRCLPLSPFPSPSPSLFSLQVSFPSPPPDTGTIVPLAASANVRMPNVMLS